MSTTPKCRAHSVARCPKCLDIEPPDPNRAALAEAWFAGYDKGNLDGYFGTRDERKNSPYADLDPYRDEATS
jgi:hypothetical protein